MPIFWLQLSKFYFWKGDWALGYVSTQISDPYISWLPKILCLRNLWGNSIKRLLRLDIEFLLLVANGSRTKTLKAFQWWFWPKSNVQNSAYIWNYYTIVLLCIFIKVIKYVKKVKFGDNWEGLWTKICLLKQCWTKYLKINNKIKQKSDMWIYLHFDYNCQNLITGNETMN